MTLAVRFDPRAEAEFAAIVRWYDERRPDLGSAFADAVEDLLAIIAEAPLAFVAVNGADPKGRLCVAKVLEAVSPVTVYRVWNSKKGYTELGQWWSFGLPKGPDATYREWNAICPEWSDLDRLSVCKLKVGARVAVGPGQSADCATVKYARSKVNQVFIPNDARVNRVYVTNCRKLGVWPQGAHPPKSQAPK